MDASLFSYNSMVHAVAGSLAAVTAMSATYPLDNIRLRIQLDELNHSSSTIKTLVEILKEEGVTELYRGIKPTLQSLCASNFVYFYVFHGLKGVKRTTAVQNLLLAGIAGAINVLVTTPLWVVNTRIKLGANYHGLWDGLVKISETEGLRPLWASVGPSFVLVLNPALVFMIYETLKKRVTGGGFTYFLLGATAKSVATIITYPLQIIQTKMRRGCKVNSSISLLCEMVRTKGFVSMYKGMESKVIQTVITAALMFLFYEKIANFVFYLMRIKVKAKE